MPSVTLSYFGIRCSVRLSVCARRSLLSCAPPSVTNPSGAVPRPFLSFTAWLSLGGAKAKVRLKWGGPWAPLLDTTNVDKREHKQQKQFIRKSRLSSVIPDWLAGRSCLNCPF